MAVEESSASTLPQQGVSRRMMLCCAAGFPMLTLPVLLEWVRWSAAPELRVVVTGPFPLGKSVPVEDEQCKFMNLRSFVVCEEPGAAQLGVTYNFLGEEADPPRRIQLVLVVKDEAGNVLSEQSKASYDPRAVARESRRPGSRYVLSWVNGLSFKFDFEEADKIHWIEMRFREM